MNGGAVRLASLHIHDPHGLGSGKGGLGHPPFSPFPPVRFFIRIFYRRERSERRGWRAGLPVLNTTVPCLGFENGLMPHPPFSLLPPVIFLFSLKIGNK